MGFKYDLIQFIGNSVGGYTFWATLYVRTEYGQYCRQSIYEIVPSESYDAWGCSDVNELSSWKNALHLSDAYTSLEQNDSIFLVLSLLRIYWYRAIDLYGMAGHCIVS